ncbi:polyketide synthase [Aspergillus ustus]|uniref:Polyketide synthase n=1 Tax=Aspergillus ustus TaxID=40382 RepID=A0A0C1E6I9_ASPUT|nr:polyketide synthase [Aspergillus ustus]
MQSTDSHPQAGTLLVFGPQSLTFDKRALARLRDEINSSSHRTWIQETLAGLPTYWSALCDALPDIPTLLPEADHHLNQLSRVLDHGLEDSSSSSLPNILLTPLVVLTHLIEYSRYLTTQDTQPQSLSNTSTSAIGFCTGLLATYAIASTEDANTPSAISHYGTVALRLATLIGALVDAEESRQQQQSNSSGSSSRSTTSHTVGWSTPEQEAKLHEIVKSRHPDVYVSVRYDRARCTLTSSGSGAAAEVTQALREAGLTATEVRLQGRFHDPNEARGADVEGLVEVCSRVPELQFAAAPKITLPGYTEGDNMAELAIRGMLVQFCDWYGTLEPLTTTTNAPPRVVCFGSEKCIPPTLTSTLQPLYMHSIKAPEPQNFPGVNPDNLIAVVGMAIKTAGADDVDEFAQMLRTGKAQHVPIKPDNIDFDTPWRAENTRQWYCNFVRDRYEFDHSFFKMSPREAAAMDPQHRLFLMAAYQAVEQSGYWSASKRELDVATYVGISTADYEQHVACYDPNAYTATGNLRAFLAGRIAHQFGWTGPAMTVDTACSSSAVAVHLACRAILSGECTAALAGGVATMTSPFWFQNLGAASFISPTGQCKPFDEAGDGYCRAEGVGCVVLKRMSDAVANGDQILGCIAATAVQQNQNCTPMVVPNRPSLSELFRQVVAKSGLSAADISLVEAHGTGTAVGDPAEYESIRAALDVSSRSKPLTLGSVKGHVGHTEAAAGIVSLIKVLTMMNEGFIPPQASHNRLSPRIQPASDKMQIASSLRAWDAPRKAALVNSYGASGSNTSTVLIQPPKATPTQAAPAISIEDGTAVPFWITGRDERDISAYSARLLEYIQTHPAARLADISFNLGRQSNRTLDKASIFSARSLSELQSILSSEQPVSSIPAQRPVILCFGGQVSTFIGLNRAVYDTVSLLRRHLDECDAVMREMGLESIYPDIFNSTPITDTVKLQCMLFAMQYSCARAWIESGLHGKIAAVVGHSFGELTSLCVSGILSIRDTIKLVSGRAQLIRDNWGADKGAMMAVEGDESIIQELLAFAAANATPEDPHPATIACYNGPRSFTLAGSTAAIAGVKEVVVAQYPTMRHKVLNVTNSFHCSLAEGIVEPLTKLGEELVFNPPTIHIEHARPVPSTGASPLPSTFAADHLRKPVYFNHAVQRLAQSYPDAIWLEAGSNSTITAMAGRAIRTPGTAGHHFQALNITHGGRGVDGLTEATTALWKEGLRVSFWKHHSAQSTQYAHLLLPPRVFARTRHVQEITAPKNTLTPNTAPTAPTEEGLWTFIGYEDGQARLRPRFKINSTSPKYLAQVEGHVMARTAAICPAGLEVDMAIEALYSLHPEWSEKRLQPMLVDMVNSAPVCLDPSRTFWLQLSAKDESKSVWEWNISSTREGGGSSALLHVKGGLHIRAPEDAAYRAEFAKLERMVPHRQCTSLLDLAGSTPTSSKEEEIHLLQGRNVYQGFSDVIQYTDLYHSLWRLVGNGSESAGCVLRKRSHETWLDVPLSECFMQTGGIWVSCMTDRSPDDVFIATGCEQWMRSPKLAAARDNKEEGPEVWHVLARHQKVSDKVYLTDVFVFDSTTGQLTEVILGTKFSRIPKTVMRKILTEYMPGAPERAEHEIVRKRVESAPKALPVSVSATPSKPAAQVDISEQVRQLLSSVSGIEPVKINHDADLADLGVDSLMAMELAREIEGVFKFSPDHTELLEATTVQQLTTYISTSMPGSPASPASLNTSSSSSIAGESTGESTDSTPSTTTDVCTTDDFQEPFIMPARDDADLLSLPEGEHEFLKPHPQKTPPAPTPVNKDAGREAIAEEYVARYSAGFAPPAPRHDTPSKSTADGSVVIITGATGSLGAHLVASFARNPTVRTVVCLNRRSNTPGTIRQRDALSSRMLTLTEPETAKLRMLDGATSEPNLGLSPEEYTFLADNATHIVHNAWPMSLQRPIHTFAAQFQAMRNLLDLAVTMSANGNNGNKRIGFQLVSSISVVGSADTTRVLESRVPLRYTLPLGYPEAKWVCERMLDETLHRFPEHFRPMVVRPGQITGSHEGGIWPHTEHMPMLIKTAQALGAWPDLDGPLHWIPVDTVADTMMDLLLPSSEEENFEGGEDGAEGGEPDAYPVYHIDNPLGQPWKEMNGVIARILGIPAERIIPYGEFLHLLQTSKLDRDREIPAAKIMGFFTNAFLHMACGGLVLDTARSEEHSVSLAGQGVVSEELVRLYVERWKSMGVLRE